jgi:hypothetical protein
VGRAVGHHLPKQNKEAWVRSKAYTKQNGKAKHFPLPRTHAVMIAGGVPTALRERPNGFLQAPARPSKTALPVGPEHLFAYYLEKAVQKFLT